MPTDGVQSTSTYPGPLARLARVFLRCHPCRYPHFFRQGPGRFLGLVVPNLGGRDHAGSCSPGRVVEVHYPRDGLVRPSSCPSHCPHIHICRCRSEADNEEELTCPGSLPYALRFRQCLIEYHQSRYTSPRPLANALKYFSAFPVILLSALQKTVVADLALSKGISVQELKATHDRWFGEHRLFRLWLLAVVVNSMFSFYWDVEMDWGLRLCEVDTWFPKTTGTPGESPGGGGAWGRGLTSCFRRNSSSLAHQRSPCPTPTPHMRNHSRSLSDSHPHPRSLLSGPSSPTTRGRGRAWLSFGLRPVLLLPDPIVYHIFTLIDLVLRFTWSLKLSSHLHTIAEIESGVFMMEALELLRRWMWVFVRVEWEAVKQAEVRSYAQEHGLGIGVGQVIWHGEGDKDGV